jgi:hypothetical protein
MIDALGSANRSVEAILASARQGGVWTKVA